MKRLKDLWDNGFQFNWWGEFCDGEQEEEFQEYILQSTIRRFKFSLALCSGAYLCGVMGDFLDNSGFTPAFWTMASCRAVVFFSGMGIIYIAAKHKTYFDLTWYVAGFMILIGVTEAISIVIDKQIGLLENGVPFVILMVLFYYLFSPPRLLSAVIGGWVTSLIYIFTLAAQQVSTPANNLTVGIFLLLANLFGYYFFMYSACGLRNRYLALTEEQALNRRLQVEIAERKKAEELLLELATIDSLTNVANRRHLMALSTSEMNRFRRTGSAFCILMIDIDHFKAINDNYGHDIGDMALKKLVEICRSSLRVNDVIGRMGGEEFMALLPDTDLEQAVATAQRIRHAVESISIETADGISQITISIGVAACTDANTSLDSLLKKADIALYRAKRKGRNTVCFSPKGNKNEDSDQQD